MLTLMPKLVKAKVNCSTHPIYCQIIKNKTIRGGKVLINKDYAMKLSNIIYKMHKKYHVPSRIFTAILMQESGYKLDSTNCIKGYLKKEEEITKIKAEVCQDFGISMINRYHIDRGAFEVERLLNDLEYSVEAGAIILADFMERYEARENDYWVRYNCGEKGSTKRITCKTYKKLVERYL